MQELYNAKRIDDKHVKITKFDKDLNPKHDHTGRVSSYVVSEQGCDCPQGHAKSCRHRKMLPFFLQHDYVDTEYFFVWDTHQWYKPTGIFAQARQANGKHEPKPVEVEPTTDSDDYALLPDRYERLKNEGGPKPASATPSSQPSTKTYRRF